MKGVFLMNKKDYNDRHEMMIKDFKRRPFISLIVTIPIIILQF